MPGVSTGLIGPNALTQMLPPLEQLGGPALSSRMLALAGIVELPDMSGLIDEAPVVRLHEVIRAELPGDAKAIAREAGRRTASYILEHRIPKPVQSFLQILPAWAAARLLAQAIKRNAWTFVGSGTFGLASFSPLMFTINNNPMAGVSASHPVCDWHTSVFRSLFQTLVCPKARVVETDCCAAGDPCCAFSVTWT